jgi:hypothetical protein
MDVATWILLALALLGGTDVALYHVVSHGLRQHPGARGELVFHALRGPTYALLFLAVPNLRLDGAWFAALLLLLGCDLAISVGDFLVERDSRRDLGGLPSGEYLLHVLMAILFGALVASILILEGHRLDAPSAMAWEPAPVPAAVRLLLAIAASGVLISGFLDLRALSRPRSAALHRDLTRVP